MVESVWSKGYDAVVEAVVSMRREAGLTQRDLADLIGREQSFIGRIETKQRRVDIVEFCWIARCCGFDGKQELEKVTDQILDLIPNKPRRATK